MKKSKLITLSIFSVVGVSLAVGSVCAAWAVTDNAPSFDFRITTGGLVKKTVTYYLPTAANSNAFTSHSVEIEEGTNLYTALSSFTTAVGSYQFTEWHYSSSHFRTDDAGYAADKVSNTVVVNEDMTVYAKYVQPNVGYYYDTTHHYVTSSSSKTTIASSSFFYGDRIYSLDGVQGSEVALTTSSGNYRLTKNSNNWSVKRIVKVGINDVTWWTNDGAKIYVYLFGADDTSWTSQLSFSSNKATIEVDAKYTKFIAVRDPGSVSSGTFDGAWNQTVDVSLTGKDTGSQTYSSTYDTIYIQTGKDGSNNYHINWWS